MQQTADPGRPTNQMGIEQIHAPVQWQGLSQTPMTPSQLPTEQSFIAEAPVFAEQDLTGENANNDTREQTFSGGPNILGQEQTARANQGTGIDARTKMDPKEEAENAATNCPGAPGAADGRVALLQSALICDLPQFLVKDVLENPKLQQVKDPASVKVHSVELLKLLTTDPGYGMKFQIILDQIPAWKKYKSQDHSLFITAPEVKTEYFLTDGGSSDAKKLLTQS
jgi:hypothetical protein